MHSSEDRILASTDNFQPRSIPWEGRSAKLRGEDSRKPAAASWAVAGTMFPKPGLRGRFEVTAISKAADRPRSAHFPEGRYFRSLGEARPSGE
ncbi:MAG: hypothetical protein DRJ61_07615 [Acidobacteria bacterium]|nr:MAG: hypothetical protein DRJ61_07615 [Acidobacteriota bacterium]